jgi:hypothetical protein
MQRSPWLANHHWRMYAGTRPSPPCGGLNSPASHASIQRSWLSRREHAREQYRELFRGTGPRQTSHGLGTYLTRGLVPLASLYARWYSLRSSLDFHPIVAPFSPVEKDALRAKTSSPV